MSSAAVEDAVKHPDAKYPHLLRPSPILLGYNNEDVAIELHLLDHLSKEKQGLRVLMVTGGADNFMSVLAHPSVEHVTSADMNPIQQALGYLKLELACSDLSNAEILTFMGTYDTPVEMDRKKVYEETLKPKLPSEVASLIEEKLSMEIEHGYNRFSSIDNQNRHFNKLMEEAGFSRKDIFNGSVDMEALKQFCNKIMDIDEYLFVCGFKGNLPPPLEEVFYKILESGGMDKLADGHYRISKSATKNHLASITLLHEYTDSHLPDWLARRDLVRDALRKKRDNLKFVNGVLLDVMDDDNAAKYDLVSPSNIFDWTPMEKKVGDVSTIMEKCVADDGMMLLRMAFGGANDIANDCDNARKHPEFSEETLRQIETAPFFHDTPDGLAVLMRA